MEFHVHIWCQCLAVLTTLSLLLSVETTSAGVFDNDIDEIPLLIKALKHEIVPEVQDVPELGCHLRDYIQPIDKSIILWSSGETLPCMDNVTVKACYGSCDSSEVSLLNNCKQRIQSNLI